MRRVQQHECRGHGTEYEDGWFDVTLTATHKYRVHRSWYPKGAGSSESSIGMEEKQRFLASSSRELEPTGNETQVEVEVKAVEFGDG